MLTSSSPVAQVRRLNSKGLVQILTTVTEDPLCISDSEPDAEPQKPKMGRLDPMAFRYPSRGEARKEINYNTKRHPQDQHLPRIRKRRRTTEADAETVGV